MTCSSHHYYWKECPQWGEHIAEVVVDHSEITVAPFHVQQNLTLLKAHCFQQHRAIQLTVMSGATTVCMSSCIAAPLRRCVLNSNVCLCIFQARCKDPKRNGYCIIY